VKIAPKDVSKVPASAEGAILPYLYDFFYEREVILEEKKEEMASMVKVDKMDPQKLTPQKPVMVAPSTQSSSVQEGNAKKLQDEVPKSVLMEEVVRVPPKSPGARVVNENIDIVCTRSVVRSEKVDVLDLLRACIDRVQGLSGADFNDSEDEMVSKEVQQSQTKGGVSEPQQLDMVLVQMC
jgi:hypothetical protein